jgi:hypothetical protein
MKATELLLYGVAGWSAIGVVGVIVAHRRGERQRVRQGVRWLVGVLVVYFSVLVGLSLGQKRKIAGMGEPQCFGKMCFTVMKVERVPGFLIRDGRRLLRVSVQIKNRGRKADAAGRMRVYLVDAQGRRWEESVGVGGIPLNGTVMSGETVWSEPVFKVAGDATGLGLVFTQGRAQPGALVLGDQDSLLHQPTVVKLDR